MAKSHLQGEKVAVKMYEQLVSDGHDMTILNLQALLIWVHVASTQFTMHLAKGLKNVVKKLNSSAWIFMHSLSTVQPDMKILEKFRLKWIWI